MVTLKKTANLSSSVKKIQLPSADCHILPEVSLANYTSYRVGGNAQWYVEPKSYPEIQAVFEWLQGADLPLTCLGAGSNLLVSDRPIEGLVLNTRNLRHCELNSAEHSVTVGAGYSLPKLAWQVAKRGWQGLEWAVGIPGTVGGAVVMNAGAHKGCIADRLISALVAYPDGKVAKMSSEQLNYSYRSSILQGQQILVLEATFKLQPGSSREEVMALNTQNFQMRKNTQPYDKPSCGSVFRNPQFKAAGWLIQQTGLKGYQIGGAQVSQRHANFIINHDNATASDIFNLIRHVQEEVERHWSILLHPEVKFLGQF
jgi:UDP-N-acetylmuramate dehydrogenase